VFNRINRHGSSVYWIYTQNTIPRRTGSRRTWGEVGSYGACDFYIDTTPPTVTITNPTGGTVKDTITVSADATDASSVIDLEFWLDGALLSSDSTAPYEWNWDTTTYTGSHTLKAVAYDAVGNQKDSTQVFVTVNNSGVPEFSPIVILGVIIAVIVVAALRRR
jgi:hypothetical protein